MKKVYALLLFAGLTYLQSCKTENKILRKIGSSDNSSTEFSLSPKEYKHFLEKDFGWEDKYFLVGQSDIKNDFPYVLPGPTDEWGGTWSTAGWRSHSMNILFGIDNLPKNGEWKLMVDLLDNNSKNPSVFKITINGKSWKYELLEGSGKNSIDDSASLVEESYFTTSAPELTHRIQNSTALQIRFPDLSFEILDSILKKHSSYQTASDHE